MSICYIKWYFGYKNFGDELLLIGLLWYLVEKRWYTRFRIETKNIERLQERLHRHATLLPPHIELYLVTPFSWRSLRSDIYVRWGGEVCTDARKVPYNGRTYIIKFLIPLLRGRVEVYGGIWTPHRKSTHWLYRLITKYARHIVCRDEPSYNIALQYTKKSTRQSTDHIVLYQDFAQDVVKKIIESTDNRPQSLPIDTEDTSPSWEITPYGLINLTPYLRNQKIQQEIHQLVQQHPDRQWWYISGEAGVDEKFLLELHLIIPDIRVYNWTTKSLHEILGKIAHAQYAYTTRLHITLMCRWLNIPFTPLAYQEKVTKMLAATSPLTQS